jgi:HAD superfamily hydrolase (TIGR01549 family)
LDEILTGLSVPTEEIQKLIGVFRQELMLRIEQENTLFAGAEELLKFLYSRDVLIGIATNKPTAMARTLVENTPLKSYVHCVHGTGPLEPKPHPATLMECKFQMQKRFYIMVGDSIEDIKAGINSNCLTLGVTDNENRAIRLHDAGAHRIFRDLIELREWLDSSQ